MKGNQLSPNRIGTLPTMAAAPRVLVAEDSAPVLLLITRTMEAIGCEVVGVTDGMSAFEEGLKGGYDLCLLDIFLPGMLGTEVLARWSEEGVTHKTIVISSTDDEDVTVRCFESGAVDYIEKPFNVRELQLRVRLHLRTTGHRPEASGLK